VTERELRLRLLEICVGLWFLGQALLTFSRGGVFNIVVAVVLALLVVAPGLRHAGRVALLLVVAGVVACAALFPLLNSFTDGRLVERYDQKSLARRDSIIGHDLELFRKHPIAGAGLGVATAERPPALRGEAAHTEFTRMLAEQGLFGVVALGALLAIVVGAFWRARPGISRALVSALVGWSFAEMMHSATRIALISYALGLAVAAAGQFVEYNRRTTEPTNGRTVLVGASGGQCGSTSASDPITKHA
jgi:O-antigen ligase